MDERYSHCFQTQAIWETGSDYQGRRSNSHIPQPIGINYFSQPHRFDRYAGEEQGRLQHQHGLGFHPHPHSHPHSYSHSQSLALAQPHDLHEAIYREMEKERIRQEIIMSEILRRRALEVEVRMEMAMERELALGGSNTYPFGPLPPVGLDLPMRFPLVETRSRDERIVLPLSQRNNLSNRCGSDRSVPLQFQSASDDARVARNLEVNPILEGEKQKITLQAKPIQNATGAKRARSGSDGKKAENEMSWSCALCQVSVRSEQSLNDHLEGKRHKTKEAEVRDQKTGKNYSMGLTTKKAAKPIQGDPSTQSETKFTSESLPFSKSGAKRARSESDASGSQSDGKKAENEMSCALCQVSASSEQSLNGHLEGKRHKTKEAELRAQMTGKNYIIGLTTKKAAKPIQGSGPVDPSTQSETKITSESLPFSKSGDISRSSTDPSQKNLTPVKFEKKESAEPKQVKKKDNPEKKNIRFWCEICDISVSNEQVMESHKAGKKHRRQLDKRNKCSGVGPSQKDAAVE